MVIDHKREWKWFYSLDRERYIGPYDTRDEAIEAGKEVCESDSFTIAKGLYPLPVGLAVEFTTSKPDNDFLNDNEFILGFKATGYNVEGFEEKRWICQGPEDSDRRIDDKVEELFRRIYEGERAFTKDTVEDIEVIRIR